MSVKNIPYRETHYFSDLISDYLDQNQDLKTFYNRFPDLENFKAQIDEKSASFNSQNREVLVEVLQKQYKNLEISDKTQAHIEALKSDQTFTITTGHQLNIFTGPLYFLYKIISTLNLCETLAHKYPQQHFVPVYWMATEDHDFEEINYFDFKGKKIQWNKAVSGAVGPLSLEGLDKVFEVFEAHLGTNKTSESLKTLFKSAYLEHENLTDATQFLVNSLFADYGLVIVDGNDRALKQMFVPYMQEDLIKQTAFEKVTETDAQLSNLDGNYKIQVNPRDINLFYLKDALRERIVKVEDIYSVLETDIQWDETQLLKELHEFPERFSPNVIMRPLYQEVILPNLCYIGGGGELAYWFQLKSNFEAQNVTFPILLLRNSALLINSKQQEKIVSLNLSVDDLFLNQNDLVAKVTKRISAIEIDFSAQKAHLKAQFKDLYALADQTDPSFKGAVAAQEVKQINGLERLEKRLLTAQKRKLRDHLERVKVLQDELFPRHSLQERNSNFSEFYLEYGDQLIQNLKIHLNPLTHEFTIIEL